MGGHTGRSSFCHPEEKHEYDIAVPRGGTPEGGGLNNSFRNFLGPDQCAGHRASCGFLFFRYHCCRHRPSSEYLGTFPSNWSRDASTSFSDLSGRWYRLPPVIILVRPFLGCL